MKKDDLISRKAAIEWFFRPYSNEESYSNLDVERALNAIPAVDAVPVVRGRWVKAPDYATPGGDPVWRCSECGKGLHVYGIEHGTYGAKVADGQWVSCPNCGAMMDGEAEQDQKIFVVNPNCHGLGHANCEICDSPCPYR